MSNRDPSSGQRMRQRRDGAEVGPALPRGDAVGDGERWFAWHLLDHDAAVNRGNWMWLAGVAFSFKQRSSIYHYSPDHSLPVREAQKQKIKTLS